MNVAFCFDQFALPGVYLSLDIQEVDLKSFASSIKLHLCAGVYQRLNLDTVVI